MSLLFREDKINSIWGPLKKRNQSWDSMQDLPHHPSYRGQQLPIPARGSKGQRGNYGSNMRSWTMAKRHFRLDFHRSPVLLNIGFPQMSSKQSINKTNLSLG